MSEPRWLTREEVEISHEYLIEVGGGSHGLRDVSLLESALGRPQNQYAYGESDIFQLAAGYAEGIARNHPFVDGNKRTAFQSAYQFLKDNGFQLERANGTEHADMMVELGQGHITREEMGKYLAENSYEIRQEASQDTAKRDVFLSRYEQQPERDEPEKVRDQDIAGDD